MDTACQTKDKNLHYIRIPRTNVNRQNPGVFVQPSEEVKLYKKTWRRSTHEIKIGMCRLSILGALTNKSASCVGDDGYSPAIFMSEIPPGVKESSAIALGL